MNIVCLQLPDHLYESAGKLAQKENLSLNQLVTLLLAEKISLFGAEEDQSKRNYKPYRDEVAAALAKAALISLDEAD